MLKRFLSFLFPLFILPALASADYAKPFKIDVGWHSSLSANFYSDGDSSDINYSAAAQRADTSMAIDLNGLMLPPAYTATTAASDTVSWLRISFFPRSNRTTVAADSIYLAIQASENRVDWTDTTPMRVFVATGIGAHDGEIVLENGATNTFFATVRQTAGGATVSVFAPPVSSNTEPTWGQLYGYPYIRLIVQGDYTGHYDAEVRGFKAQESN